MPGLSVGLIRAWRRRGAGELDAFHGVARARKLGGISPQPLVQLE